MYRYHYVSFIGRLLLLSSPQCVAVFNGISIRYPTFKHHNFRNLKKRGFIMRFLGAFFFDPIVGIKQNPIWIVNQYV